MYIYGLLCRYIHVFNACHVQYLIACLLHRLPSWSLRFLYVTREDQAWWWCSVKPALHPSIYPSIHNFRLVSFDWLVSSGMIFFVVLKTSAQYVLSHCSAWSSTSQHVCSLLDSADVWVHSAVMSFITEDRWAGYSTCLIQYFKSDRWSCVDCGRFLSVQFCSGYSLCSTLKQENSSKLPSLPVSALHQLCWEDGLSFESLLYNWPAVVMLFIRFTSFTHELILHEHAVLNKHVVSDSWAVKLISWALYYPENI